MELKDRCCRIEE